MNMYGECPECGVSWNEGEIADIFIKQREEGSEYWRDKTDEEIKDYVLKTYSAPYKFSRLIGIEIQGCYDGISRWQCPDCKTEWNRFTGKKITNEDNKIDQAAGTS